MSSYNSSETASVATTGTGIKDPLKKLWCQTQWTSLSHQAHQLEHLGVYFDPKTALLDKLTNKKLWQLVNRLYDALGPQKAALAHPVMLEGGSVEWRNYADECKGCLAEIVDE